MPQYIGQYKAGSTSDDPLFMQSLSSFLGEKNVGGEMVKRFQRVEGSRT